ncbi:MAG TPA: ATP-dependent helicase [bacterium]|nr:ATP-dependent helicase [bacterium]
MDLPAYIAALPAPPQQPPDFFSFGHTAEDLAALRSALKSRGIAHRIVHSGQPDPAEGEASAAPLVIWQELALPELLPRLEGLLNRCLLPARLAGAPVILLSQPPRAAYHQAVSSAGLHRDREGLWQGLYLEQLASFWEWPAEEPLSPAPLYALDDNLDASQHAAVAHLQGPIRVLAPAGSGKTRTLINRVIHLLNQGVEPGRIVALAFNKKAADEMAARLQSRGIAAANRMHQPGVVVRTFHGFGYEIIRRALGWSYDGAGEQEQLRLLMQQAVSRHHRLTPRRGQDALEPFIAALNRAKMELLPLDKMSVETEEESLPFAPVFEAFLALQKARRFCNFDDMIYLALVLLLERPGLRQELQQRFRFVLVDEFQDLNAAQILLMNLLALPHNNLFVVGDDDQMIYGWRGADVRHILDFPRRYGGAVDCTLETNYRSAQAIVRHAAWLIGHNRHRVAKPMHTPPGAAPGRVTFQNCASLWEQAREAVQWITAQREERQGQWSDFAILFRYHAYKYISAILLDAAGIPHTPVDGRSLAQTAAGRDLHAWLALILKGDEAPDGTLARALKRPNRFFPNHFINTIASLDDLAYAAESEELEDWLRNAAHNFLGDLAYLRELVVRKEQPAAYLNHMTMIIGLADFYRQQKRPFMALDEAGLEVLLDVLITVAGSCSSLHAFYEWLDGAQAEGARPAPAADPGGVLLSTIHAAKGREFPCVVLYHFNGPGSCPEEEIEEERRVAYVGATRAGEELLVLGPAGTPGLFMSEFAFDPELAAFSDRRLADEIGRLGRKQPRARKQETEAAARLQAMAEELARRSALGFHK